MQSVYDVIKKPIVTEKGVTKKDNEQTLCFQVASAASKTEIRKAVETVFKVKVADVRTSITAGKLRRRGRFAGYRSDWKKAYVRLKAGEKMPEYAEII
jgi:large subunit ribosomal protein L23